MNFADGVDPWLKTGYHLWVCPACHAWGLWDGAMASEEPSWWPYSYALLSVPQGAANLQCSLTLFLIEIFFIIPKDSSLYCLTIFLMADSASRAVEKSSVWAMVLYSSIFAILVLHRRKHEAVFRSSESFLTPLYLFRSWPHLYLEQYLQSQLITTLTMAVWSTVPLCSLCTCLSVSFQKFFSQDSALTRSQRVLLLGDSAEVVSMYACS